MSNIFHNFIILRIGKLVHEIIVKEIGYEELVVSPLVSYPPNIHPRRDQRTLHAHQLQNRYEVLLIKKINKWNYNKVISINNIIQWRSPMSPPTYKGLFSSSTFPTKSNFVKSRLSQVSFNHPHFFILGSRIYPEWPLLLLTRHRLTPESAPLMSILDRECIRNNYFTFPPVMAWNLA